MMRHPSCSTQQPRLTTTGWRVEASTSLGSGSETLLSASSHGHSIPSAFHGHCISPKMVVEPSSSSLLSEGGRICCAAGALPAVVALAVAPTEPPRPAALLVFGDVLAIKR